VRHVSRHGRAMPARGGRRNHMAQSFDAQQQGASLHLLTVFVVVAVLLIHRTSPSLRTATSVPARNCRTDSPNQWRRSWLTKPCRESGETSVTRFTLAAPRWGPSPRTAPGQDKSLGPSKGGEKPRVRASAASV
jgi:hypothetical protein